MKKIVISIAVLIFTGFLGVLMYHNMTSEETYFDYTHFKEIPNLVNEKEKVIMFVIQDGCSYCKLVEPLVNAYAKDHKGVVYAIVGNKEADYNKEAEIYGIEGAPTLIFYSKGKEVFRKKNGFTGDEFQQMIEKVDF